MISQPYPASKRYPLLPSRAAQRKTDLIALGCWAIATGRGWLVRRISQVLTEEGLDAA